MSMVSEMKGIFKPGYIHCMTVASHEISDEPYLSTLEF